MDWTHNQLLDAVRAEFDSEDPPDKLLVIALWDQKKQYSTRFWNLGMNCSEMVSLMEIQKSRILEYMNEEKLEGT